MSATETIPTAASGPTTRRGTRADRPPNERPRPRTRRSLTPYAFLAPGMAMFGLLIIFPMVKAFQMSFYDWKILPGAISQNIGWDNYQRAFHDPMFWKALQNSGFYMLLTVPPQIILGLLVAVLLNHKAPGRALFRVLFYLPVVTSWVVVSLLFQYLFADQGLVNWMLHDVTHVRGSNVSWLSGRWTAMVAISALGVWKGIGWSMMIFLAALQGVSQDLIEAATLDGAGRWSTFRAVTLPAVRPAVAFVTVMLVIGGLNVFVSVLLMTGGGPADSTQVLLTYMYKQAFTNLDFGYGSSIAVLLTIGVFMISAIQLRAFRTEDGDLA